MDIKLKLNAVYRVLDESICGVKEEILTLKDDINDANDYIHQERYKNPNAKYEIKKVIIENGEIKPYEE